MAVRKKTHSTTHELNRREIDARCPHHCSLSNGVRPMHLLTVSELEAHGPYSQPLRPDTASARHKAAPKKKKVRK